MAFSPAAPKFSNYFRWPVIVMFGLASLLCLACSAGGLFWLATPTYLGASLTQITQLEIGTGQCLDKQGQPQPGPALYFSRVFVSSDNALTIANWYMQHGWSPVNRITGRGAFLIPQEATKYNLLVGKALIYTGLLVSRTTDLSTRIMMRSSMVLCPL